MEFSAYITRACALQTIRTTYLPRTNERTYASSTMSRHSGAKTKMSKLYSIMLTFM